MIVEKYYVVIVPKEALAKAPGERAKRPASGWPLRHEAYADDAIVDRVKSAIDSGAIPSEVRYLGGEAIDCEYGF